jgi:hypothetical protein
LIAARVGKSVFGGEREPAQQISLCLNPIAGGAASNLQSNHERSTNFRQNENSAAS